LGAVDFVSVISTSELKHSPRVWAISTPEFEQSTLHLAFTTPELKRSDWFQVGLGRGGRTTSGNNLAGGSSSEAGGRRGSIGRDRADASPEGSVGVGIGVRDGGAEKGGGANSSNYQPHMESNVLFYGVLFQHFLGMCCRRIRVIPSSIRNFGS
jgi:hypothetical protein